MSPTPTKSEPKPNSINHSDLSVIFVQPQNVSTLLSLSRKLPALKTIIALGDLPEPARRLADSWSKERGVRVLTLAERELVLTLCVSGY
jgi:long-chain acyl-CoA synthetase